MNLLGKLYYVYHVYDPNGEQREEICISRDHNDYLGYSKLEGVFRIKVQAVDFARKLEQRLKAAA